MNDTKDTHWLGDSKNKKFTVIDTPGLGNEKKDNDQDDQKTINDLAEELREDIKFIHVFLLAFEYNVRWTDQLAEQFRDGTHIPCY